MKLPENFWTLSAGNGKDVYHDRDLPRLFEGFSRLAEKIRLDVSLAGSLHLFPFVASAAPREFKSSEGNSITAELVAVQGANIVLSMNGREFTVPTARFSQPDQDFIAEWKKKDLENHIPVILKMEEGAAFDRNAESRGRITIYDH
jgi:hypothetical protein